jgi:hypothetical protein
MSATPLYRRVVEAGGISRVGGFTADHRLWKEAEVPIGTDAALIAELKAAGWHVARRITRKGE